MPKFIFKPFNRNVPDASLIEDLCAVAKNLNRSPTIEEYNELGKYHSATLARRFGKWTDALKAAGLAPTRSEINIPIEELLQNIEDMWVRLGRQPTYNDMNSLDSRVSAKTYANRFRSWRAALQTFVETVNGEPETELHQNDEPLTTPPQGGRSRTINQRIRFGVLQRDKFSCVACGRSPAKDPMVVLNVDHILPWSKGGENTPANLQTLCWDCNNGKTDTGFSEP
jgi:hypothetical protein